MLWIYGLLWLISWVFAAIGTQGMFGTTPDPFAALFLLLLGMPWSLLLGPLVAFGGPVPLGQICAALFPGLNIFILWRLYRDEKRRFPDEV